jgi:hypothetical protein
MDEWISKIYQTKIYKLMPQHERNGNVRLLLKLLS